MERKNIVFANSDTLNMVREKGNYKVEVKRNGNFSASITVAKKNSIVDADKELPPFYGIRISDHVFTFFPWRLNIVIFKKIREIIREFEKDEEDVETFYI